MRKRILVVDDEIGIRESLTGIFEDEGYEVEAGRKPAKNAYAVFKPRPFRSCCSIFGCPRSTASKRSSA